METFMLQEQDIAADNMVNLQIELTQGKSNTQ